MLGTLLIFTTTPSTTVHASNDTLQPFYNNPLNPNPDAIYTGGGVEYFFRYAAIDNITGNRAYSSTNSLWTTKQRHNNRRKRKYQITTSLVYAMSGTHKKS